MSNSEDRFRAETEIEIAYLLCSTRRKRDLDLLLRDLCRRWYLGIRIMAAPVNGYTAVVVAGGIVRHAAAVSWLVGTAEPVRLLRSCALHHI